MEDQITFILAPSFWSNINCPFWPLEKLLWNSYKVERDDLLVHYKYCIFSLRKIPVGLNKNPGRLKNYLLVIHKYFLLCEYIILAFRSSKILKIYSHLKLPYGSLKDHTYKRPIWFCKGLCSIHKRLCPALNSPIKSNRKHKVGQLYLQMSSAWVVVKTKINFDDWRIDVTTISW